VGDVRVWSADPSGWTGPSSELDEEDEREKKTQTRDGVWEPEPEAGGPFQRRVDGMGLGQGKMVGCESGD